METLLNISERSVLLAGLVTLCLWRVKSASVKHAVWTVFSAGMLVQIVLSPRLRPLPIPVLRSVELIAAPPALGSVAMAPGSPQRAPFPVMSGIYFAGVLFFAMRLALALRFTRRLIRRSEPIAPGRCQSRDITVPLTAGSTILLPPDWSDWAPAKLRAVLAHEEAHVRRRDGAIALLARMNRCVFWFHPLAWWLERELARLAEQACDDAALAEVQDREEYARALLDMARAVHTSQGRLLTLAMAKEANVETRINRILDETRRIPKALGRAGWAALLACGAPLIYFAAAAQLAPAQTLMSIPGPAAPQPPLLIAQVAPAPVSEPAPEPPTRPQSAQSQLEESQRAKVLAEQQSLQAELALLQAQLRQRQAAQVQRQAQMKIQEAMRQLDQLARTAQAFQLAQNRGDSGISVDISPERTVRLGIPLGETAEYDVIVQILDQNGAVVASSRDRMTAPEWTARFSLKAGTYRFHGQIRKISDGSTQTRDAPFEVR